MHAEGLQFYCPSSTYPAIPYNTTAEKNYFQITVAVRVKAISKYSNQCCVLNFLPAAVRSTLLCVHGMTAVVTTKM